MQDVAGVVLATPTVVATNFCLICVQVGVQFKVFKIFGLINIKAPPSARGESTMLQRAASHRGCSSLPMQPLFAACASGHHCSLLTQFACMQPSTQLLSYLDKFPDPGAPDATNTGCNNTQKQLQAGALVRPP